METEPTSSHFLFSPDTSKCSRQSVHSLKQTKISKSMTWQNMAFLYNFILTSDDLEMTTNINAHLTCFNITYFMTK